MTEHSCSYVGIFLKDAMNKAGQVSNLGKKVVFPSHGILLGLVLPIVLPVVLKVGHASASSKGCDKPRWLGPTSRVSDCVGLGQD